MGVLFILGKIFIPMAMLATIGLWISLTTMITKDIRWDNKESMREVLFSIEANRMSETLKEQLIKNAVGMEILHLMVHVLPFFVCIVGIIFNHYYTIHCMAAFAFIPWVYDDFDIINRWSVLLNPPLKKHYQRNLIYILSHFLHSFCALISIIFAYIVDLRNKEKATVA